MFAKQKMVFNYISTNYVNFLCFLSCTEFNLFIANLKVLANHCKRFFPKNKCARWPV